MKPLNSTLLAALALAALTSCGSESDVDLKASVPAPPTELPAMFWSDAPLGPAQDVADLRESGVDGAEVTVRGTLQDFGKLATFKLVEDSLEDCSEMGDEDHCATPWDYCCVDATQLGSLTLNVEFLDGDLPGQWEIAGLHGLDRLSEVVVAGKLRKDAAGNMRVEATKLAKQ